MSKYRIGIDLGGTKIEGVVLDANGKETIRKRIPTERDHGYAHILNRDKSLHDELAVAAAGQPTTFGIGTPGAISPRTGLLKNSNTVCMNGQPVKADLEKLLGRKIEIQNDANCFAMAEALLGAGKGKNSSSASSWAPAAAAGLFTKAKCSPVRRPSPANGAT